MRQQLTGLRQGAHPEQPAEATAINEEMQGLIDIDHQFGKPLEGERVSPHGLRMATVAKAFGLAQLRRTQPFGAPGQMGLFQRLSNQAPADRRPRDALGRRAK
jgi:hypothetical protein